MDLLCDVLHPNKPACTWPDLKHLELHNFSDQLWASASDVETFTHSLALHAHLECLILDPFEPLGEGHFFSLQAYLLALPNLCTYVDLYASSQEYAIARAPVPGFSTSFILRAILAK